MSLANKAARGAMWTVASSMGGRVIGVLGTLIMTRFLAPEVIGEVADATILCMTASWLTIWGFGQYVVVRGRGAEAREVTWHATVAYAVLGALSLGIVVLLRHQIAPLVNAPLAAEFIPGMAVAIFIRRLAAVPERVLTRQLQFRASGLSLALGEAVYTASAIGLAALGHGGMSIVYANVAQAVAMLLILARAAGLRSWCTPHALSWRRYRDMLAYGLPLGIQGVAHQASRYWDKLAISHFFGTGAVGTYNMAYNLADIPAVQVGEQIALVLMPSLAELPRERRAAALERSTALLSLVIFPLAIGLGVVAFPLIGVLLPDNAWQEVAPLLAVLTSLSVFRPITWVMAAYMEAEGKTKRLMVLELGKIVVLLAGIAVFAPLGLGAAAAAVGIAFGVTALAGVAIVVREGASATRMLIGFLQPLAACVVMAAVVLGIDRALIAAGVTDNKLRLVLEIVAGAVTYVAAALVIARSSAHDLWRLVRRALRR